MRGFWKMVDELKAIDGMAERIDTYTRHLRNYIVFAPIELKDNETFKNIVKKASEVVHDGNDIIYTFNGEYNKDKKYFLYLEKR